MAKLGWLGLPFPEEYGGAGLGLVELAIVLEEMGRAAYPGPFFSTVVLGGLALLLGGSDAQKEKWLPAIAAGARALTAAPSRRTRSTGIPPPTRPPRREGGDGLDALRHEALRAVGARGRRRCSVPARAPEGLSLFIVDPRAPGVTLTPAHGHGPDHALVRARAGRRAASAPTRLSARPAQRRAAAGGGAAAGRGRRGGRDARRGAPLPRHERGVREGARAVRPAHRLVPGDPPQVRRDAHGGGEQPLRRLLRGVGARGGRGGRGDGGVGRQVLRERVGAARSAARPSRPTAASASRGSTTCTSTSSAPRRSRSMYGDAEYHRELIARRRT